MARYPVALCSILTLVVLSVLLPVSPAQAATTGPPGECANVVFIGLRGSGEEALPEQSNMGGTVYALWRAFRQNALIAGLTVTGIGLDAAEYPATAVLPDIKDGEASPSLIKDFVTAHASPSAITGSASLGARLRPYLQGDQSTCVMLAGYSQGAWAINGNLMTNSGYVDPVLSRISGVALLGDPWLDPTSSVAAGDLDKSGILRDPFFAVVQQPGQGRYYQGYDQVRSYCASGDPLCNFHGFADRDFKDCLHPNSTTCGHYDYVNTGFTGAAAQFLLSRLTARSPGTASPRIGETGTFREGSLVYAQLSYSGAATGFGFRGANGAGWTEESHPFTDPSYGRVSAGQIAYPFNLACGSSGQIETDVEFWVYNDAGRSPSVTIHLNC